MDKIVRGIAGEGQIRCFAMESTQLVEEARQHHNTSPVVTAALGRLLTGGAMMGAMMKGDSDLLTLKIDCSGPVKGLTVTADAKGNVKGFPLVPQVSLPASPAGKLDVGRAVDLGVLTVIRDTGLKEPYSGTINLVSGEIAEDLTYYFAASEQTPSSKYQIWLLPLLKEQGELPFFHKSHIYFAARTPCTFFWRTLLTPES